MTAIDQHIPAPSTRGRNRGEFRPPLERRPPAEDGEDAREDRRGYQEMLAENAEGEERGPRR